MVAEAVELLKGRGLGSILIPGVLSMGMKVPYRSHSARRAGSALFRAMEVAHRIEESILVIHQLVQRIRGAIGTRMSIGFFELRGVST